MKGRKYRYILVPALGSLLPFAFISAGSLRSTSSAFLLLINYYQDQTVILIDHT
ncbi:hypothetical protein J7894_01430 [Mycoplasmopsis agalactiae]|nr:hypothetical protein [Mycoplasmopsis agalactiae]MCE6090746.1 hypothetical protein [Mycoplasmopsis agalactiae]